MKRTINFTNNDIAIVFEKNGKFGYLLSNRIVSKNHVIYKIIIYDNLR